MYSRILITLIFLVVTTLPAHAKTGVLEIYTTPLGVEVFIDNIYVGLTPFADPDINIGIHQISLLLEKTGARHNFSIEINDLVPQIYKVNLGATRPSHFNGVMEKPTVMVDRGNIQLASIPTAARVEINGVKLASTPVSFRDVDTGTYQIKFTLGSKVLTGQFRINKDETGKLVADFRRGIIIDKWKSEKSKMTREKKALQKRQVQQKEQVREKHVIQDLKQLRPEVRAGILRARDQKHQIIPIEEMYVGNRSYYYSALNLDPAVVKYYKLPYDRLTLELKNLTKEKSLTQGDYYEGDYVFRYGKHARHGRLNSSKLTSCIFALYNGLTIKVRYDPDERGAGRGKGMVFVSVR